MLLPQVTPLQLVGYSISLAGFVSYNVIKARQGPSVIGGGAAALPISSQGAAGKGL